MNFENRNRKWSNGSMLLKEIISLSRNVDRTTLPIVIKNNSSSLGCRIRKSTSNMGIRKDRAVIEFINNKSRTQYFSLSVNRKTDVNIGGPYKWESIYDQIRKKYKSSDETNFFLEEITMVLL